MNLPQVWPFLGVNFSSSLSAQATSELVRPTDKIEETKYVNGIHLYLKIQNLGIASDETTKR